MANLRALHEGHPQAQLPGRPASAPMGDWAADGHEPSAPPRGPTMLDTDPGEAPEEMSDNDGVFEWSDERLDLLDRTVNKDHADKSHQMQLGIHILQNYLHTLLVITTDQLARKHNAFN